MFECRGLDITECFLTKNLLVEDTSGKVFEADFSQGDWYDYNEDTEQSVGISALTVKVEKF